MYFVLSFNWFPVMIMCEGDVPQNDPLWLHTLLITGNLGGDLQFEKPIEIAMKLICVVEMLRNEWNEHCFVNNSIEKTQGHWVNYLFNVIVRMFYTLY